MIERLHHRGWHYVLLISLSGLMFFLNLGGPSLWDVDEGRNSECSYEMMQAGNWIVPTFNSRLRVDKPVLLYWLQIFSYSCFGVNEFAARFPSALAALATVLLAYELARSMFTRTTGMFAGIIVASTPMICGAAHFANPDALLNFLITVTMTLFWLGLAQRPWWWFVLIGASSGLAVLAKGPVGLILPAATAGLFLIWERRWSTLFERRWLLAFWTFALTALPWYIWVGIETKGDFLVGFLWTHNVERGVAAMESHDGFPGYYLVVLICGLTPWSIFLGPGLWFGFWSSIRSPWQSWQTCWATAADADRPGNPQGPCDRAAAYRLLSCWILVFLVFFNVAATKLPNYVLPTVVPLAFLLARFIQRWRTEAVTIPGWLIHSGAASLMLLGAAVLVGLPILGGVGELPALRGRYIRGLELWAMLGLVPISAAIAFWWFARNKQFSRVMTAVAVSAVLLLAPFAAFGSAVFNRFKAPRPLVELADASRQDDDIRIGCFQIEHLPSLNFYVKRNVEHLFDENALNNFLNARLPVYLFVSLDDWQQLESRMPRHVRVLGRQYDLYHHTEVVLVTNR